MVLVVHIALHLHSAASFLMEMVLGITLQIPPLILTLRLVGTLLVIGLVLQLVAMRFWVPVMLLSMVPSLIPFHLLVEREHL